MIRCTLGSKFVSLMLIACGPSLGHGGHDDTDATGEDERDREADGEVPRCEPEPRDGVDPFAVERACEAYDGRQAIDAGEIEVRIVNRRPEPIYLTRGCGRSAPPFELEGTLGDRAVHAYTCADERFGCYHWTDQPGPCGLCPSQFHSPRRIEPGGVFVEQWDGLLVAEVDLPAHCSITEEPVSCLAPMALGPGRFEVRAQAGAFQDCEGSCDCELDALGRGCLAS